MRIEESGYLLHPPYGNRYVAIQVDPTQWTHVCSARFGPGRPCSFSKQTKWTGDSYRYDIFIRPEHRQIALRWFNGSGEGWLIAEDKNERGERSLLDHIAQLPDEARRCRSHHRGHLGTGDPAKADHHPETQWPTDCIDQASDNRITTHSIHLHPLAAFHLQD